jgi:CBS domain-containing protein
VVSRSDLLRVARRTGALGRESVALMVPDLPVVAVMNRAVHVTGRHTLLADAAGRMWRERMHRLFVSQDGRLVGVISASDIAAAVRDSDDASPISAIMTAPIITIETREMISVALERLARARVAGLVVVEDGWPVGMFTQTEALASRGMPADTRVEDVFDQALICLPATTRVCRAAGQIARLDVRRVVVSRDREAVGVVSALDLARLISAPARAA